MRAAFAERKATKSGAYYGQIHQQEGEVEYAIANFVDG